MPCLLSLITVYQSLFRYKTIACWIKAYWDKILAQLGYMRNSQCQHCTLNQQTLILKYKSNLHATSSVLKGVSYMKHVLFFYFQFYGPNKIISLILSHTYTAFTIMCVGDCMGVGVKTIWMQYLYNPCY